MEEDYPKFHQKLEALKVTHFNSNPDDPVVLHRSDIINQRGPFKILQNKDRKKKFNKNLLTLIGETRFFITAVVIGKKKQYETYSNPWHPYHLVLGFMLQRYCGFLNYFNCVGDVMSESRGKKEDKLLASAYGHI